MNYYSILGVDKTATQEEIKKAYRLKARETHPDVNADDPEAEEKFKKVSEAYDVLGNPEKKDVYDNPGRYNNNIGNLEDFINAHFGGNPFEGMRRTSTRMSNNSEPGFSVRTRVSISFFDSLFGTTVKGEASFVAKCADCNGLGGTDFTKNCGHCNGRGFQEFHNGVMSIRNMCQECTGTGKLPSVVCSACNGGAKKKYRSLYSVDIQKGFTGGQIIVPGKGAPGTFGGASGDLLVEVTVAFPRVDTSSMTEEEIGVFRKYLS
jgi:molecular chaperone DnaJ